MWGKYFFLYHFMCPPPRRFRAGIFFIVGISCAPHRGAGVLSNHWTPDDSLVVLFISFFTNPEYVSCGDLRILYQHWVLAPPLFSLFMHCPPRKDSLEKGRSLHKNPFSVSPRQNCFYFCFLVPGIVLIMSLLFPECFLFLIPHSRNCFCFRISVSAIVFFFASMFPECFLFSGA